MSLKFRVSCFLLILCCNQFGACAEPAQQQLDGNTADELNGDDDGPGGSEAEAEGSTDAADDGPAGPTGDLPDDDDTPRGDDDAPMGSSMVPGPDSPNTPVAVPSEPHALGLITLGETHPAQGGSATPAFYAGFFPDVRGNTVACTESLGACRVAKTPDCGAPCGQDQYCGFDEACAATCLDLCTLSCAASEVCYFAAPGAPACRAQEAFDAGALTFSGTTVPVSVFPPYAFTGETSGSLFAPESELTVSASGASAAGFTAFEQSFSTTMGLTTSPSLSALSLQAVFGDDDLTVQWLPGNEGIQLTFTLITSGGGSGFLICDAEDSAGSFTLPRATLLEVAEGALSQLSVSVTRTRSEVYKGFATQGQLSTATVQPEGWLTLNTSSSEVHTFHGCPAGSALCGEDCIAVNNDAQNCGSCGNACAATDYGCVQGVCQPCAPGITLCGGTCIDTQSALEHCGRCNNLCTGTNAACFEGFCESDDLDCEPGETQCDFECVDLQTDVENCGQCGTACDEECVNGACFAELECEPGSTQCGAECIDTSSDPQHCGACNNDCGGEGCFSGVCDEPLWLCEPSYFGDGECDCGCGSVDSDCPSASSSVCVYCYCDEEELCESVDPANNGDCL